MLEPLQNGGRKFNLSWLRGFSLGLCKDPWVFCGTNASRSLLWDSGHWSTQKTTKTPSACHCKPPLSFCWKQALVPHHPGSDSQKKSPASESIPTALSHTDRLVTWMLSAQNASSHHPTSLPPPSALFHVVTEWSYGFYRTCLIRECIYKTVWLTVMNHRITNLRG